MVAVYLISVNHELGNTIQLVYPKQVSKGYQTYIFVHIIVKWKYLRLQWIISDFKFVNCEALYTQNCFGFLIFPHVIIKVILYYSKIFLKKSYTYRNIWKKKTKPFIEHISKVTSKKMCARMPNSSRFICWTRRKTQTESPISKAQTQHSNG